MKQNKSYLIFISVIVLTVIIALEFAILPLRFKLPRNLALIGFASKPNTTLYGTSINSIGFTGDVISQKKDPEKIRILTLGGSSIFVRRMTEKLQDSLNHVSSRPVEILGAALPTHNSMASLIKFETLSNYNLDYVLIYHAANDIFVNNVKPEYFKRDYSHMLSWYRRNLLLDHSLIARVIYNKLIWGRRIFGMEKLWHIYPTEELENAMNFVSEELFMRNMTKLVNNIQRDSSVPILMTFAWSIPRNYSKEAFDAEELGYNNPDKLSPTPVELWGKVEYVEKGMQKHNSIVRQIAEEHNNFLIDQENLIGKNLLWFGDVFHLSEEGTDKFIQNITNFFVQHDLL